MYLPVSCINGRLHTWRASTTWMYPPYLDRMKRNAAKLSFKPVRFKMQNARCKIHETHITGSRYRYRYRHRHRHPDNRHTSSSGFDIYMYNVAGAFGSGRGRTSNNPAVGTSRVYSYLRRVHTYIHTCSCMHACLHAYIYTLLSSALHCSTLPILIDLYTYSYIPY